MERINIHYHGDPIDHDERAHIKAQIGYYMGDAPSDATACCCLSREPEGFACNLRVHSAKGHVYIHRESKNLETLMTFIYDSMKDSFEKWHRDPNHFAKSHPMEKVPCKSASHRNLQCPIDSLSEKS